MSESLKNKYAVLFVVVSMSFMSCLDSNIVNIALPVMSKKLSVSMASIEWVIASYTICICSTLLIFGRLGDIYGKMKIFKLGMLIFTAGSFMCSISNSLPELAAFRVIQGIGASAYMANNQGIITQIFPGDERGKALGILASSVALGTMVGSPLGGFITAFLSWKYIFLINVPIGVIAFMLALKIFPKNNTIVHEGNQKLDVYGSILSLIAMIFLFGSLIEGQKSGYKDSELIIIFILSIVFIIVFLRFEKKIKFPLLQINIFENKIFSLSLFCAFISFLCLSASVIIIPFYLQDVLKMSSDKAGLVMMIQPLIIAAISPFTGALSDKAGSQVLSFAGLLVMSISFLFISFLNQKSLIIMIILCIAIMALGQSLFQPANNSLIMSDVSKDKLGIVGSVNSLVRLLGQNFGIILSTTILYAFMSIKMGHHVIDYVKGRDDVFIYGMRYVYIILFFICIFGALSTAFRMNKSKSIIK